MPRVLSIPWETREAVRMINQIRRGLTTDSRIAEAIPPVIYTPRRPGRRPRYDDGMRVIDGFSNHLPPP